MTKRHLQQIGIAILKNGIEIGRDAASMSSFVSRGSVVS